MPQSTALFTPALIRTQNTVAPTKTTTTTTTQSSTAPASSTAQTLNLVAKTTMAQNLMPPALITTATKISTR